MEDIERNIKKNSRFGTKEAALIEIAKQLARVAEALEYSNKI